MIKVNRNWVESTEIIDETAVLGEIAASDVEQGVLDEAESESQYLSNSAPSTYEINSYGADYDVAGLVRRLESGEIFIPPFQRNFVWNQPDASRFIESLLLGFPVPAIFLSKEARNRFLVVDGQQRLRSLQLYYGGLFSEKKFKLVGINSRFQGASYDELSEEDRRNLDNALIHTIIVQQVSPAEPAAEFHSSIYLLFERLNSWGRPLYPQEIRACVDHGPFMDLLRSLNDLPVWRTLYGPKSKRLKDEELILRFFALFYCSDEYAAPMKSFLDRFCSRHRDIDVNKANELSSLFEITMDFALSALGSSVFRPLTAFNSAVFDSISVAIARRLRIGPVADEGAIAQAYKQLLSTEAFTDAYSKATAREEQVETRLRLATEAFRNVR